MGKVGHALDKDAASAPHWQLDELQTEITEALRLGSSGDARLIEGRAIAVKASPILTNSTRIVIGTAALPPGYATTAHSHEAEEAAVFLSGSGTVEIDGVAHRVAAGTVLLTPSNAVHVTHADPGTIPLVALWFYAPPGSEARWLELAENGAGRSV